MAGFFKRPPKSGAEPVTTPERGPRRLEEIKPDPDRIGISGSVPFARMPAPDTVFAERAARFRTLAVDHPLGGYLAFLAHVADAQAAVRAERRARSETVAALSAEDLALRAEHGMPALARSLLADDPAFASIVTRLLAAIDLAQAPAAARAARDALAAATPDDRLDLAVQIFEGALPVERMAECVFVSAALQVFLAEHAAHLDPKRLKPVADGVCPACGGAPCASLIVSFTPADKARYLACTQCGTLWNHVRIRCTACGSGEDVTYLGLDEVSKDVQVEACGTCHGYVKHLHQHRDPALDPVADDVASYGLDLKVAEDGFRKVGLNLLFVS
ncbi:formate dehydrogenase accessory protein FdhE [Methylobacterium sp. A54F]